jgi:hypothetical protein
LREQDERVEPQVGHLAGDLLAIAVFGGDDHLGGFLAYFLGDTIDTF